MTPRSFMASILALLISLTPQFQTISARNYHAAWFPISGSAFKVLAPFDLPNGPFASGHRGIDVSHPAGTPVYSPVSGVVTFSGLVVDRETLSIAVSPGLVLSLEPVTTDLREGDTITAKMKLGISSPGGHCAFECVHIGVRSHNVYVNPLQWFRSPPQLLPLTGSHR